VASQGIQSKEKPQETQLTQVSMEARFSGPLPTPQHFEGYERVCPGAADRILSMAENQTRSRLEQEENKVIEEDTRLARHGQVYAFALGFLAIIGGVALGIKGQPVLGGTLITIFGGTLCIAFLKSRHLPVNTSERQT